METVPDAESVSRFSVFSVGVDEFSGSECMGEPGVDVCRFPQHPKEME